MRRCVLLIACLAACTTRDSRLASAVTDTLPGSIVRVTSSGPTAWTDTNGWKLVELSAVQPAQGSQGELISPSSIAVDEQRRLYVADQKPTNIKVFDSAGALVRIIGREGDGPGEFRSAYIAVRGNRLLVHDPRVSRTSFFDTSGTFLRSFHSVGLYFGPVSLDAAGRAVLPLVLMFSQAEQDARPRRAFYRVRFDSLGTLLDTVSVPQLTEDRMWVVRRGDATLLGTPIPFAPRTIGTYGRDSGLVYGATNDFAIMRTWGGRDTSFIMRRAWTAPMIPDDLRRDTIEGMIKAYSGGQIDEVLLRNTFHPADVPTMAPGFSQLLVDDRGNTWVQEAIGKDSTRFDVFAPDGRWLGPVVLAAAMSPYAPFVIHGSIVYLATEDADGFPVVRRWLIQDGRDGQDGQGGRDGQEGR
jgi:hypothetical protein